MPLRSSQKWLKPPQFPVKSISPAPMIILDGLRDESQLFLYPKFTKLYIILYFTF